MPSPPMQPLTWLPPTDDQVDERSARLKASLLRRRTVREFSARAIDRSVIERCLAIAGSAPSGANQQPWHFVAVSAPLLKRRIRAAAEAEEREFYGGRAPDEWLDALSPLGTGPDKPFLEIAPWLVAIFAQPYGLDAAGEKLKHYYVQESVGIATGMLIAALHECGLATLTHTPSPMGFLNEILDRPRHERAFLLLVVGHPEEGALVPQIVKKPLDAIVTFRTGVDAP